MKHLGHIWIVIVLLMFSVISEPAQAWGWLSLYPTQLEAVLGFYGRSRRPEGSVNSLDTQWEAGVRINQQGYILDPAVADFNLEFAPRYVWGRFGTTDEQQKLSGNNMSYVFNMDMLSGTPGPFSYNVSAMRATNFNSASLGGRFESEIENKSAAMHWKTPVFPMSLTYDDRYFKNTFLAGKSGSTDATTQRNEHVKILTVKGRSSKTNLFAEHRILDNLLPGRDLDYVLDRVNLNHNLPWGRGSRLNSRFEYYDRSGFNANTRLRLDEGATIQHTDNISSLTNYSFSTITAGAETITNNGNFILSHQLYSNLFTTANLSGLSSKSDLQDLTRWRSGLGTTYNKNLFGVGVTAGLRYAYGETDRDSRLGLVEVIDESHLTPLDGAVILNRRFIVTETIIVTNADGSLVYTDGIDYTIFDLPEDLTQLQIIPGGRIETGDTILVSYQATALPSQEYSTTNTNYNLGFNLGWVNFSHTYGDTDEKLLSGEGESFLNPRRDVRSNLEFRWNISNVELRVGAERRFSRFRELETTTFTYRQNLSWDAFENTVWNLNSVQSFTESTTRNADLYNLELTVVWQPLWNLTIRPRLGAWKRFDERIEEGEILDASKRDDLFITAGATVTWVYRKVTLRLSYHHNQRTTDSFQDASNESKTSEDRLRFFLTRRF